MKDQKGFTTIELMISFIIISAIIVTMLASILSIREAQYEESVYSTAVTTKNSITKHIQDDLTIRTITSVDITDKTNVKLFLGDGNERTISITSNCITYLNEEICLPKINEDNSILTFDTANITTSKDGFLVVRVPIIHPDLEQELSVEIIAPIG